MPAPGRDPSFSDLKTFPELTPDLVPRARICFNTTPADTAEAVQRWI
jgi:hypothetical protein